MTKHLKNHFLVNKDRQLRAYMVHVDLQKQYNNYEAYKVFF